MKHPTGSNPPETYRGFVSRTFLDNQERRRLVADAITQAGMVWHGMENFTAEKLVTLLRNLISLRGGCSS